MVQFEVLEEQQQQGGNTLHNDLLVPVHVDAQLHALENSDTTIGIGGVNAKGGRRARLHTFISGSDIMYTGEPEPRKPQFLC